MNPYAKFLGDLDPLDVIPATSARLQTLLETFGPEGVERSPAPGKWSPREILCHLADCELIFAVRLRQTVAEPHHTIQPFDQELWAAVYSGFTAAAALDVFRSVREWNLALLKTVPPTAFQKPVRHPERGEMTFQTLVQTMAGHDLNHLRQLDTLAS